VPENDYECDAVPLMIPPAFIVEDFFLAAAAVGEGGSFR